MTGPLLTCGACGVSIRLGAWWGYPIYRFGQERQGSPPRRSADGPGRIGQHPRRRYRSGGDSRMARIAAIRAGDQGAGTRSLPAADVGRRPPIGTASSSPSRRTRPTSTPSRPSSSRCIPAIARSSGGSRASSAGTPWRWWSRANRDHPGIGGHISTYASAATLYEVAFNHFFPRDAIRSISRGMPRPASTPGRFWKGG